MARQNYYLSASIFLFSIFFLYMASKIEVTRSSYSIGPAFWPSFLLIAMVLLSVALTLRTKFSKKVIVVEDDNDLMEEFVIQEGKRSLYSKLGMGIVFSLLGYIVIIPFVGFIVASFLFIATVAMILGLNLWKSAVFSIISTVLMVALFVSSLNISFPKGIGVFRTLNSFFY